MKSSDRHDTPGWHCVAKVVTVDVAHCWARRDSGAFAAVTATVTAVTATTLRRLVTHVGLVSGQTKTSAKFELHPRQG